VTPVSTPPAVAGVQDFSSPAGEARKATAGRAEPVLRGREAPFSLGALCSSSVFAC